MKTIALILGALLSFSAAGEDRTVVFSPGDGGSKYYRIPAVVATPDGALLAVADKRIESMRDLPGKIEIVVRRSEDGGRTWGETVTIAPYDSIGGCGDPALVVDEKRGNVLCIYTHGNGLWQKSPGHISVAHSADGGKTWSKAIDLNPQILSDKEGTPGKIRTETWFATSGRALQLRDGRLMFAVVARPEGAKRFLNYAVYSDDGGYSWRASAPAYSDGDEAKIIELSDGTLMMSIRVREEGPRKFVYSRDRGETWSEMVENSNIIDPACNGDLIEATDGTRKVLLHSLPGVPDDRRDVSVYTSFDEGNTWPVKTLVVPGGSAYSSLVQLPDGSIGILTEEETADGQAYEIAFRVFPLSAFTGGR